MFTHMQSSCCWILSHLGTSPSHWLSFIHVICALPRKEYPASQAKCRTELVFRVWSEARVTACSGVPGCSHLPGWSVPEMDKLFFLLHRTDMIGWKNVHARLLDYQYFSILLLAMISHSSLSELFYLNVGRADRIFHIWTGYIAPYKNPEQLNPDSQLDGSL